jgi:50S ribosomal protein L16 3-hydroxylase
MRYSKLVFHLIAKIWTQMALQEMLNPMSLAEFVDRYFLQAPLARPGVCLLSPGKFGMTLLKALLDGEGADALAVRRGEIWADGTPTSSQLRPLLDGGYTIRIRHAEKHTAELTAIYDEFATAFHGHVDIHVYATPAGCKGLDWHYDAEDVFVFQTEGIKVWSLRKNTVNPWPLAETIPADQRAEREVMPIMTCELQAGDCLYIPNGYWHRTHAVSESVSLSIGVMPYTAMDVYDSLRPQLLRELKWRQRLVVSGVLSEAEQTQRCHEQLAELGRDLAERLSVKQVVYDVLRRTRANERREVR